MNYEFGGIRVKVSLGATLLMADSFISILMSLISLIDSVHSSSCILVTSAAHAKHIIIPLFILSSLSLTFTASVIHLL